MACQSHKNQRLVRNVRAYMKGGVLQSGVRFKTHSNGLWEMLTVSPLPIQSFRYMVYCADCLTVTSYSIARSTI